MTTKQVLQKLLDRLPDDATIEDVQYQILVLQKIRAGEDDLETGRMVPTQATPRRPRLLAVQFPVE